MELITYRDKLFIFLTMFTNALDETSFCGETRVQISRYDR